MSKITSKIFDFLTKMANFRTFIKCQKCTGIFKIFGRPFLQKFWVFIKTIETVNGTQYPTVLLSQRDYIKRRTLYQY